MKRALEYFGGDELAASVWIGKYALKNEKGARLSRPFLSLVETQAIGRGTTALVKSRYFVSRLVSLKSMSILLFSSFCTSCRFALRFFRYIFAASPMGLKPTRYTSGDIVFKL